MVEFLKTSAAGQRCVSVMKKLFSVYGEVGPEISGDEGRRKKDTSGGGSLSQRAKHSPYIQELGSQLVSETGKDILTIPLGGTEPVLYRIS